MNKEDYENLNQKIQSLSIPEATRRVTRKTESIDTLINQLTKKQKAKPKPKPRAKKS